RELGVSRERVRQLETDGLLSLSRQLDHLDMTGGGGDDLARAA
ncbi:MAG: sigma factor-like helix-turn-helix DNA-binding protein, partial [Gaiellales bacterium]